jgi:hypothetical protein
MFEAEPPARVATPPGAWGSALIASGIAADKKRKKRMVAGVVRMDALLRRCLEE